MARLAAVSLGLPLVFFACTPSSPQQRAPSPASPRDDDPDPDPDESQQPTTSDEQAARALELRREAKWRIAEWDLSEDLASTQLDGGAIRLCAGDQRCDPAETPAHGDLDSLQVAIDELAERHYATAEAPRMAIRRGVPDVLAHLEHGEDLRDIDRMFWALTVLDLYFTDDKIGDAWVLEGMSLAEAEAELAWLARRYGLRRAGWLSLDWAAEGYAELLGPGVEPPEDDLMFGVFERGEGSRYLCALDAPPGKYCCYVYCDQLDGEDILAEGH